MRSYNWFKKNLSHRVRHTKILLSNTCGEKPPLPRIFFSRNGVHPGSKMGSQFLIIDSRSLPFEVMWVLNRILCLWIFIKSLITSLAISLGNPPWTIRITVFFGLSFFYLFLDWKPVFVKYKFKLQLVIGFQNFLTNDWSY